MGDQIEYDYGGCIKAGMKSEDAVNKIRENKNYKELYGERLTVRIIAGILRKAGHKEVWDDSYIPSKEDI